MIRKDEEGNIIGCKHCGSRQLKKDGCNIGKVKKDKGGCVILVLKNS